MDSQHRKDLKTDKFAEEVTHSIQFVSGHRKQTLTYVGAALAALIIGAGVYYYRDNAHAQRQADLNTALQIKAATTEGTNTSASAGKLQYPTQDAKTKAELKAFQDVVTKHSGSDEAALAEIHLGMLASDEGNIDSAIKYFQNAASYSSTEYAAMANYNLAQAYIGTGKDAEAEKLLRALVASPTALISKEQSTLALARLVGKTKKDEAKKLLEPLEKDKNNVISRNAQIVLAEISK